MTFLNGSKGSKNRSNNDGNDGFQGKSQRHTEKKQNSCHFVRNGMRKEAFLVHHQSRYLVGDFNGNNRSSPDPQPLGELQQRDQFIAATNHKSQIRQAIQQCTRFTFAMEFPGEIAVQHIAKATNEINHPKSRGLGIEKQKVNGS